MSERVACESCKRPMSAAAARCPHCGAMQSRAPAAASRPTKSAPSAPRERAVLRDVSPEEARALIAVHDVLGGREPEEEPFNLVAWLFLPDPRSQGGARAAEIALTILALPLLLGGALGAPFAYRRLSRLNRRAAGRGTSSVIVVLGALAIASSGWALGWSVPAIAAACVGEMLVLGAREWIRGRSRARYARPDLTT